MHVKQTTPLHFLHLLCDVDPLTAFEWVALMFATLMMIRKIPRPSLYAKVYWLLM